ncbi:MAG TPA: cytochrome c biogenesis protein CcsA, partial [Chthonomonadaceae bacterium]|nr:cytochrome c biogenesis protein CcsA [Chthonomonadaceae bacterium]
VGAVFALMYLLSPSWQTPDMDAKSAICMELGFVYCILATITGSIFAYAEWNSFWNWDPRETSIVIMLLLYAAYLVLRGALAEHPQRRAKLAAVFAIVALIPGLFLIWVVPRLDNGTLHPKTVLTDASSTSLSYKIVLSISFLAFTLLFVWLFQLRLRAYRILARKQMRTS